MLFVNSLAIDTLLICTQASPEYISLSDGVLSKFHLRQYSKYNRALIYYSSLQFFIFAMLKIFYFIYFLGTTYLHVLSVFLLHGISFPYGFVETLCITKTRLLSFM